MSKGLSILLIALPLIVTGCVSKNTFQQKVNESELLTRDVAQLNATVTDLRQDKQDLQEELSTLNDRLVEVLKKNSSLQQEFLAASTTQQRQKDNLGRQEDRNDQLRQELAAQEESNEQLRQTVADLNRALEKEKVARKARLAKVKSTYDQLVSAMEEEIERGELTISNLEGQLSVNLLNNILFDSGETQLKPDGRKVLKNLGDVLNKFPDKALRIEGHSDNVQISSRLKERYPTNWELSTARATSVVHFLQDDVGLPGKRLVAAGYSEYRPVTSNETAEGRARNRRIQISLVPFNPDQEPLGQ